MKRIILFFILSCITIVGQDKTIIELDALTSPASNDYFPIWDASVQATKRLSFSNLQTNITAGLSLDLADDYTWTGSHNFTSTLQLPTTLASSLTNGLGFNSNLLNYSVNDSLFVIATRDWVSKYVADSGYAVDTNQFVLKAGNNTLTGNNTFSGANIFTSDLISGLAVNVGVFKFPHYTSTNAPTPTYQATAYFNTTDNKLRIYDSAVWHTFLNRDSILALIQTGAYLQTTGTQTGLSSTLTWSSGTITPNKLSFGGNDAGKSLILPKDKNRTVSAEDGSILFDYNNTENIMVYDGDGATWLSFMHEDNVGDYIEDNYLDDRIPADSTNSDAVTLDWLDKNYSQMIVGDDTEGCSITVNNYTSGWTNFYIAPNGGNTNINISGVTIKWIGGVQPTFSDSKYYKVTLEYYTADICLGSYSWYN